MGTCETLEALAAGEVSVDEAEARLAGYVTGDAGRFDAAREQRRGVPEAILGDGKTPADVAELAAAAVETTGRALAAGVTPDQVEAARAALPDGTDIEYDDRARVRRGRTGGPDSESDR